MRNEGGMKPVATLVAAGERAVADAAVHTLWLLARDAKTSLRRAGSWACPACSWWTRCWIWCSTGSR